MTTTRRAGWLLLTAIASIPILGLPLAQAQVKVENGRSLDANTRIGSGGYNGGVIPPASAVGGNEIVTGNVTGGQQFRGTVPYTDSHDFRGHLPGSLVDRFIAGTSGVPAAHQPAPMLWQSQPFYGSAALASQPPAGYSEQGFTGIYTPAAQPTQAPLPGMNPLGLPQDLMVPSPGDMMLPGLLDSQSGLPTVYAASPLMGLHALRPGDPADRTFVDSYSSARQDDALARLHLDPAQIQRMRQELARASGQLESSGNATAANDPNLARPLPPPFESPMNPLLSSQPLGSSINPQPMSDATAPRPGMELRLTVPPTQQSTQQAELEKRLNRFYVQRLATDEEKYRDFLKQLRAREAANANPANGLPGTGAKEGTKPQPPQTQPDLGIPKYSQMSREILNQLQTPRNVKPSDPHEMAATMIRPRPLLIKSLATGVKAEGLAKLLTHAEELMKEGRYISAIDQYEAAEQVAPNNAMVLLGQAHAELGAAYYKKAESHFRMSMAADPSLLMAQFDLQGMIGQQRLETLVKDLKDVAKKQESDPGPVLLLAYLAYNTGSESQAGTYLTLADQRAGGKDEFVKLLQTHWQIPLDLGKVPKQE